MDNPNPNPAHQGCKGIGQIYSTYMATILLQMHFCITVQSTASQNKSYNLCRASSQRLPKVFFQLVRHYITWHPNMSLVHKPSTFSADRMQEWFLNSKETAEGQGHLSWGRLPLQPASSHCVQHTQFHPRGRTDPQ